MFYFIIIIIISWYTCIEEIFAFCHHQYFWIQFVKKKKQQPTFSTSFATSVPIFAQTIILSIRELANGITFTKLFSQL